MMGPGSCRVVWAMLNRAWLVLILLVVILIGISLSGCCGFTNLLGNNNGSTSPAAAKPAVHGSIAIGAPVQAIQTSVGQNGGTITVDNAASPVKGLAIVVPAGAYSSTRTLTVSTAPVTSNTFGEYFNPVSPLITVDGAHDYADNIIQVTIPINVSDDQFVMAFYYDNMNKTLEGIPIVSVNNHSITIATRHFSNIIVSAILKTVLDGVPEADSGFRPGVDDWEFANDGSYATPKGECAGQSVTMMWYYTEQRQDLGMAPLNGLYKDNGRGKTSNTALDDTMGYRYASDIHVMMDQKNYINSIASVMFDVNGSTTLDAFKYSILMTGEPQQVFIYRNGGGHAIVCYKVSGNTMYVADPNYPGQERTIQLSGTSLMPYSSGANAQDIATKGVTVYPEIVYIAKSGLIPWNTVGSEYADMSNNEFGDDLFPGYSVEMVVTNDDGTTSIIDSDGGKNQQDHAVQVNGKNVTFRITDPQGVKSNEQYAWRIVTQNTKNHSTVTLNDGHNSIGIEGDAMVNGNYTWLGFDWFDLYYVNSSKPTATPTPVPAAGTDDHPKITSYVGPTSPLQAGDSYKYSVTVEGGTPPYTYTWEHDYQVVRQGPEYSTVTLSTGEMRYNGMGYLVTLKVQDSRGQEAMAMGPNGWAIDEFDYYVSNDGTVSKTPAVPP